MPGAPSSFLFLISGTAKIVDVAQEQVDVAALVAEVLAVLVAGWDRKGIKRSKV